VLTTSALKGEGIGPVWEAILAHRAALEGSGEFARRRREQAREWMWSLVEEGLHRAFRRHPVVAERVAALEADVEARRTTPAAASQALLKACEKS
jgi:LAO/AO transport system kinase